MWPLRATIGPCSPMRAQLMESIHARRRGILIGAGAVVTGAFVKKATAFSRTTGEPLILPPAKRPEETLYIYRQESDDGGDWRVSLGPDQPFAPPPPT